MVVGRGFCRWGVAGGEQDFAMLVRGRLVVKLPRARVDAAVVEGAGVRFDANRGADEGVAECGAGLGTRLGGGWPGRRWLMSVESDSALDVASLDDVAVDGAGDLVDHLAGGPGGA